MTLYIIVHKNSNSKKVEGSMHGLVICSCQINSSSCDLHYTEHSNLEYRFCKKMG